VLLGRKEESIVRKDGVGRKERGGRNVNIVRKEEGG
jgi:hypothetical protein